MELQTLLIGVNIQPLVPCPVQTVKGQLGRVALKASADLCIMKYTMP